VHLLFSLFRRSPRKSSSILCVTLSGSNGGMLKQKRHNNCRCFLTKDRHFLPNLNQEYRWSKDSRTHMRRYVYPATSRFSNSRYRHSCCRRIRYMRIHNQMVVRFLRHIIRNVIRIFCGSLVI